MVVAAALLLGGCPPEPVPTPLSGDLQLFVKRGMNFNNQACPITYFTWQVDPVAVNGVTGTKTAFTKVANPGGGSSVPSTTTPQFPFVCNHDQTLPALAAGTWRVSVKTLHLSANCTTVVPTNGTAQLTFTFNAGGEVEGCR